MRAIKNLDSMTLEELIGILKIHEQDFAQDEGTKKKKLLTLTVLKSHHPRPLLLMRLQKKNLTMMNLMKKMMS